MIIISTVSEPSLHSLCGVLMTKLLGEELFTPLKEFVLFSYKVRIKLVILEVTVDSVVELFAAEQLNLGFHLSIQFSLVCFAFQL